MTRESAASAETVTDVAYLRTFSKNLAPPLLRLVAALNGFPCPAGESFDYCELGSGNGDTTATLAAAHPEARFLGVDLNPTHVEFANGLATKGGLDNLRFVARDFEELLREDLPPFDFITAHGVLSWISAPKRRALAAVAEAKLKPGGLLYVSYNALPGWGAVEPLRRLMVEGTAGGEIDTLDRARRGLALAQLLHDAQALYFVNNPAAKTMLETMTKSGLPYVVHEYFTPHWHPMYFSDVAREMAELGLYYIGELPLHLNFADLAVPKPLAKLFEGVTDRIVYESLKDYALNEFFRRDVYIKGTATRSLTATHDYLDATPFGTLVPASHVDRVVRLPDYAIQLDSPLFDALLPVLAERPRSASELAAMPELAPFGAKAIRDALLQSLFGDHVAPMRPGTPPLGPAGPGRLRVCSAYNRMVLEQLLGGDGNVVLASPAVGTGIVVSTLGAVSLRLLTEVEPADRPAWIRAFIARTPLKLRVGERSVEDDAEKARIVERELVTFEESRVPKLVQLGVLEREAAR
jgi:SAM-dependent methyltransferase